MGTVMRLMPPLRPSPISSSIFSLRLPIPTLLPSRPSLHRREFVSKYTIQTMAEEAIPSLRRKQATPRIFIVSSFSTELLEMHAEDPSLHILFIPGNPGVVSFYKDFVEALYELLEGNASITAIGHISHTRKDWECGRMFSLQDQIDHKIDFIKQELHDSEPPVILIGHSIGSYICLEIFKRFPQRVKLAVGLYPFLTLNRESIQQSMIGMLARSSVLCVSVSFFLYLVGSFPYQIRSALIRRFLGQSWSATAVDAACTHLMRYHTMRNVLFMARTEFTKLSEEPDWKFMEEKQTQIALLFGIDDHWGPLSFFEKVSSQVPGVVLTIEREGHTHAYSCTEAGSRWVAHHVATLIKSKISN